MRGHCHVTIAKCQPDMRTRLSSLDETQPLKSLYDGCPGQVTRQLHFSTRTGSELK